MTIPPRLGVQLASIVLLLCCAGVHSKPYVYNSYATIIHRLQSAAEKHPSLVHVYSAQERFGLPSVGNCSGAEGGTRSFKRAALHERVDDCTIWVAEITNFDTYEQNKDRPEMLISGEVHGNERVGPQASVEFLQLLVESYGEHEAFTRLVDTRVITVVPTANAVGFFRNTREEYQDGGTIVDPNRDFPFNLPNGDVCMRSVAARAINELFLSHLFRVLVTFHGGTNALAYEWGDKSHCSISGCAAAPDFSAMDHLARRAAAYAGTAGEYEEPYVTGDMGDTVYSVNGGMEDWSYGASWAAEPVVCDPANVDGYDPSRTTYNDSTHRCVAYLVETSGQKAPEEEKLGGDADPLRPGGAEDGHVPRNLRLLLAMADALQPHVELTHVQWAHNALSVEWIVSGAFTVLDTWLEVTLDDSPRRWRTRSQQGNGSCEFFKDDVASFRSSAPLTLPSRRSLRLRVVAEKVDLALATPSSADGDKPQSHFARARADVSWVHEGADGRRILGASNYTSPTAVLDRHGDWQAVTPGGKLEAEANIDWNKLEMQKGFIGESINDLGAEGDGLWKSPASYVFGIAAACVAVLVGVVVLGVVRRRRSYSMLQEEEEQRYSLSSLPGTAP